MGHSLDANKRSIGEILGRTERRPVVLPEFQRPFSWEKNQVAAFWSDLIAFLERFRKSPVVASYFLGPIVILDGTKEIIVLDGQQRLATSTILLAKIRDLARSLSTSQEAGDFARDLQRDVIEKSKDPVAYSLTLGDLEDNAARKAVRSQWNTVVEKLGKRDVSRFLRHLWISKYGDLKARGLYSEIKTHLAEDRLTSLKFTDICADESGVYVGLIEKTVSLSKSAKRNIEGLLDHLGANNSLPLLLSGFQCLSPSDFEKLVKSAVSLYVRHTLIANQDPAELETGFYEAARTIRAERDSKATSSKALSSAKKILQKLNPNDAIVREQAKELRLTRSQASWFMIELANNMQSQTKEIGMNKVEVRSRRGSDGVSAFLNENLDPTCGRGVGASSRGRHLGEDSPTPRCRGYTKPRGRIVLQNMAMASFGWECPAGGMTSRA